MLTPLLSAILIAPASALLAAPPLGAAAASAPPARSPTAAMRHNDFVRRFARAQEGRLRLCVHRTNNHIYAQVVDDSKGYIVASASTIESGDNKVGYGGNCATAEAVGKRVAERALEKGVQKVWFDRNGRPYHGRIAALAGAAREAGLSF